jgi:HemK-like putative methylase
VLDIGTGSGAIAITLKLERPGWEVSASDISGSALQVARRNDHALGAGVAFFKAHLFPDRWKTRQLDLVVSNPPYLELSRDRVSEEVLDWEPHLALEPRPSLKVNGLKDRASWCAERILIGCAQAKVAFTAMELSPRVARLLELRWRKHPRVARLWRQPDLAGRKRFLLVAWADA